MEPVDVRGRFVWHQLATRDVPGARKFYPKLSGWKTQAWPLDPNFTICQSGDLPTAGMMAFPPDLPADAPAHWLLYIGTRDVDATAQAAVRGGGSIVKEPEDMPGAGRYAVLRDPQGAVFAIIDPENARAEPRGVPPIGQFSWHELATTDHEAAFAFYSNLFGWEAMQRMDLGPMGIYLIFGYQGDQKGGIYIKPPDMTAPPNWLPYLRVADVDAMASVVEGAGGKVMLPPMDVPGGSRVTVITDPAGAAFALHASPDVMTESADGQTESSRPAAKSKPTPKASATPKARAKPAARVQSKAKAKSRYQAKSKSGAKSKSRAQSKSRVGAKPKASRKAKARNVTRVGAASRRGARGKSKTGSRSRKTAARKSKNTKATRRKK